MLFYLECFVLHLKHYAQTNIQIFSFSSSCFIILSIGSKLRVVGILHPLTFIFFIFIYMNKVLYKVIVKLIHQPEFTTKVYHRTSFIFFIYHEQRWNAGSFSHLSIVSTESRSYVYYTGTIFGSYIIAGNYAESFILTIFQLLVFIHRNRVNPREQLFVMNIQQVSTFIFCYNTVRYHLVAGFIFFERSIKTLSIKICRYSSLSNQAYHRVATIWIE